MTGLAFQMFIPSKAGGAASEPGRGIDVNVAASIDTAGGVEAVALAGVEVVGSVGGRGVDGAGAGVGGDVSGQNSEDRALQKRMLEGDAVEGRALEAGEIVVLSRLARSRVLFAALNLQIRDHFFGQFAGNDIDTSALAVQGDVFKVGMEGDGQ